MPPATPNTTHPAIIKFRDRWLFFSHNGGLPDGTSYSRSIITEPMSYNAEGRIRSIPATTEGVGQMPKMGATKRANFSEQKHGAVTQITEAEARLNIRHARLSTAS